MAADDTIRTDRAETDDRDPLSIRLMKEFTDRGLVGDKYTGLEEIARGGMGIIYQVVDVGLERSNVLKVINPDLTGNAEEKNPHSNNSAVASMLPCASFSETIGSS